MIAKIGWVVGLFAALLLCFGYLPLVHPAADSFALMRPVLGLLCGFVALLRGPWILRLGFVGLAGIAMLTSFSAFASARDGADLRVYSKNLNYRNHDAPGFVEDVLQSGADVVMLQEVTRGHAPLLGELRAAFPHQADCGAQTFYRAVLLSRQPFLTQPTCSMAPHAVAAHIDRGGQAVWVVSVHIPWPWPAPQAGRAEEIVDGIETLRGPVVAAGDFNSFPWTDRLRRMRAASDAELAGPLRLTLDHPRLPVRLPLDFVLAPGGGRTERRPLFGSDHHGLMADIGLQK